MLKLAQDARIKFEYMLQNSIFPMCAGDSKAWRFFSLTENVGNMGLNRMFLHAQAAISFQLGGRGSQYYRLLQAPIGEKSKVFFRWFSIHKACVIQIVR